MRILLYIEPVVFREDPLMLSPWVGWFARLVRSCKLARPRWQFGLVSNPSICERMTSETPAVEMPTFLASQSDLLRAFEFDRGAYARDLFRYESDSPSNAALIRRLMEVKQAFHPDLVLSFSQNRYVRPVLQTPALFIELGPLPRSVTRPHFFLDPLGHQTESLLVTEIRAITSRPLALQRQREVQRFWFETCEQPITAASSTAALQVFLHESRRGRKVVLLALQPPDWLTYEGAWRSLSVSGLMMHWLDNLPAKAVGCVSYHPLHQLSAAFEQLFEREHNNVLFLPQAWRQGCSEYLLPLVDATVTISSSLGAQSALWGKPLLAVGSSQLSGLSGDRSWETLLEQPVNTTRWALLEFFTHRYGHPADLLLDDGDYTACFLEGWRTSGFSVSYFLDTRAWLRAEAERRFTIAAS